MQWGWSGGRVLYLAWTAHGKDDGCRPYFWNSVDGDDRNLTNLWCEISKISKDFRYFKNNSKYQNSCEISNISEILKTARNIKLQEYMLYEVNFELWTLTGNAENVIKINSGGRESREISWIVGPWMHSVLKIHRGIRESRGMGCREWEGEFRRHT